MEKLSNDKIFIKDAQLKAVCISPKNKDFIQLIERTKELQVKVLKLKEIDKENLKMVVQL